MSSARPKIFVTKSFLPPINEFNDYVNSIWEGGQLTNQGPLLLELEQQLSSIVDSEFLHFVSNGTIALQLALRALDITEGEVITTPFSYVATTSAILWERCKPVFVDIEPETFCIDPKKIELAITPHTKAIMAVHVFGNPCDIDAIEKIAEKHKIKVIYDGAHAFGVNYQGKPLLNNGDISTCSFHATKLFHTIEGGCIVAKDKSVSDRLELLKRFGHQGDDHRMLGINAKANEFQAAMGLCCLKYLPEIIEKRKKISERYNQRLTSGKFKLPSVPPDTESNYIYYPVVFESDLARQRATEILNKSEIFPRRYFFPSLNTLPYIEDHQPSPISEDIASRILCLPLYSDLSFEDVDYICQKLLEL